MTQVAACERIDQEIELDILTKSLIIMKKLGKLKIEHGKILKEEELLNLKGGDWCGWCDVTCPSDHFGGQSCAAGWQEATILCDLWWSRYDTGCRCTCY